MGLKFSRQDQLLLMNTTDRELIEVFPEYSREELRSYKRELLDTAKAIRGKKKRQYEKLLEKENKRLQDEIAKRESEVKAALRIADNKSEYVIKVDPYKKLSATVIILASDWHVEEKVKKSTVNGLNEFSLVIAEQRITRFFNNAARLISIAEKDTKIDAICLALLGDFISSNIHDELLENTELRPIDAIIWVMERIQAGIKLLREKFPNYKIVIPCCPGNHSRITHRQRYATEAGNSLEYMMYNFLKSQFEGQNITFLITDSYHVYLEVYGKTLRFHHGSGIRYYGGISGIFTPMYKAISQWNKGKHADFDFCGHWHQIKNGGNFMTNGSLIGFNPYAIRIKADFESPLQSFVLLLSCGLISMHCPIILE